ncbi:MAG: sugar phosphate isomerase/epimerase, partial [Lachnospiraceae bacterium]|nr:sugar phosphate isomerase/epimerase [Lachnospiraceae bacterium]
MLGIGVQTQNAVTDDNPFIGFERLKKAGFTNCDFSLNGYLKNTNLYQNELNQFFNQSTEELCEYFRPHKEAAKANGIGINQMHMPYPAYIPTAKDEVNEYLWEKMIPKSMA